MHAHFCIDVNLTIMWEFQIPNLIYEYLKALQKSEGLYLKDADPSAVKLILHGGDSVSSGHSGDYQHCC